MHYDAIILVYFVVIIIVAELGAFHIMVINPVYFEYVILFMFMK